MSQVRPFKLMDILEQLEPLPADQREVHIAQLGLTPQQLQQVRASLQTNEDVEFLDQPPQLEAVQQRISALDSSLIHSQIGQYRILRLIGEGGMGVVYEAEQQRPHRRVALKVIRPGYMSAGMLRRFEYEADVLARLEHPGIARIYEAGIAQTDSEKQPFFAMEFVDGQRLDRHVASTHPPIDQRLRLLISICHAVQHAHTKGIIHRDLKPANILITSDGSPKILDFGVARMTDSDIQATTLHTEPGQLVGTLPYMAPEQASGKVHELDTSSDVYALGVISYELLSGRMPYRLDGRPLHEAVRVICEEEPSRLSSIDRNLRGDVETIVQKALEKDKTRRYATAGEFAADVKRYLDYEPIAARPPSTWYQFRRFARRNRALVTGATAALVGLFLLSITLAVGFVRERHLRTKLAAETLHKEAFASFLSNEILAAASPDRQRDSSVSQVILKSLIEPAAARVGEKFKETPIVEAYIRFEFAKLFRDVGRVDLGLPQIERATEIRRQLLGDDHPDTLICLAGTAIYLEEQGKFAAAEPVAREAWERQKRVLGEDHPATLTALGTLCRVLRSQGKLQEAEPMARDVLERRRRLLGPDDPYTITSLNNYAAVLFETGRLGEAAELFKQAWESYRRTSGDDSVDAIGAMNNYAAVMRYQGRYAEAEPLFKRSLDQSRRVAGDNHPDTIQSLHSYAEVLCLLDRNAEAEPLAAEAVERSRRVNGDHHPRTIMAMDVYGRVLMRLDRHAQAEPVLAHVYQIAPEAEIPAALAARYMTSYGICLMKQSRFREAEPALREAYSRLRDTNQLPLPRSREVLEALSFICDASDRADEARSWRAELAHWQPATQPAAR